MAGSASTAPERAVPDATAKTYGARSSGQKVVFKDGLVSITGKEGGRKEFIPRRSDYKIWVMPDNYEVRSGTATGKIVLSDLDAGWYRIKVVKRTKVTPDTKRCYVDANWGYEFLVGVTEEEFRRLQGVTLKWVRQVMTTDSMAPTFKCTVENCEEFSQTRIAAVLHQWKDHFNIDPLKASAEELDSKILPTQLGNV